MKPFEEQIAAVVGSGTRQRGGPRKGSGRKRTADRDRVAHRTRPPHGKDTPLLVTLRAHEGLPSFRTESIAELVRGTLVDQQERGYASHFQIVELAIQDDELHLIVEASDRKTLRSGLSGFTIGFAKRLNARLGRRGQVWADRWHGRQLTSPREVREALVYIFRDAARNDPRLGAPGVWSEKRPRTWLLDAGWQAAQGPVTSVT